MASGSLGPKQARGYFAPLADCRTFVYQYSGGAGAGGSFLPGAFTAVTWNATAADSAAFSTISSINAGGLLRDMGKTVVSSNRTFRKVQLVRPSLAGGVVGTSSNAGAYLTGYIELATGNQWASAATPAPVAYLPGIL